MAKRNQVYTCTEAKCQPLLFRGKALLEINADGVCYSLNPTLNHLQYYSDTGTPLELEESGGVLNFKSPRIATCPHCQQSASIVTLDLDFAAERETITKKLDTLDARVSELMKMFQGK